MTSRIYLILLFSGLMLGPSLGAQTYRFQDFQQDSLPFGGVNALHTSTGNRVWLGTDNGLFLFDGTTYQSLNKQLKSRTIRGFTALSRDSLLFINHEGIQLLITNHGQEVPTTFMAADSLGYPSGLHATRDGTIWIGYEGGRVRRFSDGGTAGHRSYKLEEDAGTAPIRFSEDEKGRLWALVAGIGLYQYDARRDTWRKLRTGDIRNVALNEDRIFLLAGRQLQIGRIYPDGRPGRWISHTLSVAVDQIYPIAEGKGILAGIDGLFLADWGKGRLQLEPIFGSNDPHRIEELPFKNIRSLLPEWEEGQLSRIWVATDRGFGLLWKSFFESVPGMPFDNVLSLDRGRGKTARISMGALYEVDGQEFSVSEYADAVSGISSYRGGVFLGGNTGSLIQLKGGVPIRTIDQSERGGGIFYLYTDSQNLTWFCQAPSDKPLQGVAAVDGEGRLRYYGKEGGLESRILVVAEGGREELYAAGIGTQSYLYRFDRASDRFENVSLKLPFSESPNFEVHDLAVDAMGLVWLATTDGLLRFDGEFIRRIDLGRHTTYEIRSVAVDPNGGIWAATDTDGLLYLPEEGAPVRFGEQNGMPSSISSYRALHVDTSGRLWMGTAEGLIRSSRRNPQPGYTPSPVLEYSGSSVSSTLEVTRDAVDVLQARTFAHPADHLTYQYRISPEHFAEEERHVQAWIPAIQGEIPIQTGKSGHFIYEIRGRQGEGYFWSTPSRVGIKVLNPWYRQTWFYILLAAVLVSLSWLGWSQSLKSRVSDLELALKKKSLSLDRQSDRLRQQQAQTKSTKTHLYLLERLVRSLSPQLEWDEVWGVFRQLIHLPISIDRITIYTRSGTELLCTTVSRENTELESRRDPFDEKLSLPSCIFAQRRFIYINDLSDAGQWPVSREMEAEGSLLYIPFNQGADELLFSAYSHKPEAFTTDDIAILKLLVSFISRSLKVPDA